MHSRKCTHICGRPTIPRSMTLWQLLAHPMAHKRVGRKLCSIFWNRGLSQMHRRTSLLMKEVPVDIKRECHEEIMDKLFAFAWPHISRMVVRGLPEWYKDLLLKKQFEREDNNEKAPVEQAASGEENQSVHSGESEAGAAKQS